MARLACPKGLPGPPREENDPIWHPKWPRGPRKGEKICKMAPKNDDDDDDGDNNSNNNNDDNHAPDLLKA